MNKRKKVMANLELLCDYLADAKTVWEAMAYQKIGEIMFELSEFKKEEVI